MGTAKGPDRARIEVAECISREQGKIGPVEGLRDVPQVKSAKFEGRNPAEISLSSIRKRLHGKRGQEYWRSLEEVADTPGFLEVLQREFPAAASEWWDGASRRMCLEF